MFSIVYNVAQKWVIIQPEVDGSCLRRPPLSICLLCKDTYVEKLASLISHLYGGNYAQNVCSYKQQDSKTTDYSITTNLFIVEQISSSV